LLVRSGDSPGVLARVADVIARLEGNITRAEVVTFADTKARLTLEIRIRDIDHLEEILRRIGGLKDVESAERT
ncbi:MAG TPA: ACT domain-containing protein, partial [Desulfobaccales bacterium]|nr:ACT domain-containing protein [Desulfobaccales bacterium]